MELKIPPPILALAVALSMWGIARAGAFAAIEWEMAGRVSLMVLAVGLAINIAAVFSFRSADTTINPLRPETATQLVNKGIYRFSRNPMYLGVLLVLCAWAIWLRNPVNSVALLFFFWYITRFQIGPEENALAALFPEEFDLYKTRVRRWI